MKTQKRGIQAFLLGFRWAGAGLVYALTSQRNMRIHMLATLLAVILSVYLGLTAIEWAVLCLTCALVWMAEMLNTALETTLDVFSPEFHPQVKIAKDVAAGAVLVASIGAVMVGLCLWGPKLWALYTVLKSA